MEYMNCEQYVLGELKEAQATIANLLKENDRINAQLALLEGEREAKADGLEARINDIGRREVYRSWFYETTEVGESTFDDWCEEAAKSYSNRPRDISKRQAIEFFKPELRAAYDERRAIEKAEADDE